MLDEEGKARIIAKDTVSCFTYEINKDKNIEVEAENGIFYKIEEIELICFNTGVCFFNLKTHLEDTNKFTDLLDFNYRFREINSEFSSLKEYWYRA